MRAPPCVLLAAAGLVLGGGAAPARGVTHAQLAQAAKAAPLRLIDYGEDRCDNRTVGQWLTALTAGTAKSIIWLGGRCQIVGPGIDAGSSWCGRAEVELRRPIDRNDHVVVEIFFDKPVKGRPGAPYAFRSMMQADDGQDMARFRKDFEADWTSRFPAPEGAIVDCPS